MQIPETGPIPKPVRWAILALLTLAVLGTAALCVNFTLIHPDKELAIVSFGAMQTAVTGLVVVALLLFSFRMKQTQDIQRIIDNFFIEDVMMALQGVETEQAPFVRFTNARQFKRNVAHSKTLSEVSTDFCRGRDAASFVIHTTDGGTFDLYLKVNVRHIAVKYFFDPALFRPDEEEKEFMAAFHQTLVGAHSVGYTHKLIRRYHASKRAEVLELSLYNHVPADMLASASERLFLRNDLRTMTASMLHSLNGVRAVKAAAQR